MLVVAVISVDANVILFFGFLSRDLTCHQLQVTGIGKFIISSSM